MYIKFNFQTRVWEAYRDKPIIRGGEKQPSYVSPDRNAVVGFINRVNRMEGNDE